MDELDDSGDEVDGEYIARAVKRARVLVSFDG